MEQITWEMLTAPMGKCWADEYIDFKFLDQLFTKGHKAFGGKTSSRWFPAQDPGLRDYRWATSSGTLRPLLGGSVKIDKVDGSAVFVRVLYLSPAREVNLPLSKVFPSDGWNHGAAYFKGVPTPRFRLNPADGEPEAKEINLCVPGSCEWSCVTTSGQMPMGVRARYAKTWYFLTEPVIFLRQILSEMYLYAQEAYLQGKLFYARLNGTSDIWWEKLIKMDKFTEAIEGFGGFYDYTKHPYNSRVKSNKNFPKYYHLTYSVDERADKDRFAGRYLEHGFGIAVVTPEEKVKKLLKKYTDKPFVVDGDLTDFRFADPPRAIVLLKSKGALVATKIDLLKLGEDESISETARMYGTQPCAIAALKTTKVKEDRTERGIDVTMGGRFQIYKGKTITEMFPAEKAYKEREFEQTMADIDTFVKAVSVMNDLDPITTPVVPQKPLAIQNFKPIGISQSESMFFFEDAEPFMDIQAYREAGRGRYTKAEYDTFGKDLKEQAENIQKLIQLQQIAEAYHERIDRGENVVKSKFVKEIGVSADALRKALVAFPTSGMDTPTLSQDMLDILAFDETYRIERAERQALKEAAEAQKVAERAKKGTRKRKKTKKNPTPKLQVYRKDGRDPYYFIVNESTGRAVGIRGQLRWFCEESLEEDVNDAGFEIADDWSLVRK